MWDKIALWWAGDDPKPTHSKKLKFAIINRMNLYVTNEVGDAIFVGLINTPAWFQKWIEQQSLTEGEVYDRP